MNVLIKGAYTLEGQKNVIFWNFFWGTVGVIGLWFKLIKNIHFEETS